MRLPVVAGIIDRRILANYRIAPDVMAAALPKPFKPLVVNGFAIGGICLIRLKNVRPRFLPIPWGIGSENAAHRIAVEWEWNGIRKQGVYIPRRDTSSWLNSLAGGRIFPGIHHHASFDVSESDGHFSVTMNSDDGSAAVHVSGTVTNEIDSESVFGSIQEASKFFAMGSLGYSDTQVAGTYDGLELECQNWKVEPLAVENPHSSYFENTDRFPSGSVHFDCALLMRSVVHEWHSRPDLCCETATIPD